MLAAHDYRRVSAFERNYKTLKKRRVEKHAGDKAEQKQRRIQV